MANDILGLVSEQNRPFWCEVYAMLEARREGWPCFTMALPVAIRVIECGGFHCSTFEFVETIISVLDKRLKVFGDHPPSNARVVNFGGPEVAQILARLSAETHITLRHFYPIK